MSESLGLVFSEDIDPERFLDVVVALGGVRHPDEWILGRLSRESRHVWIYNADPREMEESEVRALEGKLGGVIGTRLILDLSWEEGTEQVVLELVEAAAQRWHVVVDHLDDRVFTVDELRDRKKSGEPYLFSDPLPPRAVEETDG
ncbi:MAG: hypothetical protein DLM55_03030 [Acidimicrobiales bacterium]|nr:MAG: hypothetical protein DLM55_03030 [Acidimicrobiales bacterium]